MTKILLACPISQFKEYIIFDWLKHIQCLEVPSGCSLSFLLVDNSRDISFHRKVRNKTQSNIHFINKYKGETLPELMCRCMNFIRKTALKYDYLFSLECDVFPPVDILKQLLAVDKPVVSACYNIGAGDSRRLMLQFPFVTEKKTIDVKNVTLLQGFEAITGKPIRVFGSGLGCTLIKRDVFNKIKMFRVDKNTIVNHDTFFYVDAYESGVECWLHTGVFCEHYNSDWKLIREKYDRSANLRLIR